MPIVSKYSNERVENITQQLLDVLINEETSTDLALMCLGNTISSIVNSKVPVTQREKLAENFAKALLQTIEK
jgi:uncharacterized protein YejL (UPF0352 family)